MPLTTRCGRCGRQFPVYAQQLKAHRSRVVCPQCGDPVDPLAGLVDEPGFPGEPRQSGGRAAELPPARPPLIPGAAPTPVQVLGAPAARQSWSRVRLAWALLCLVLCLTLGVQVAWWWRAELLRDPRGFQVLSALCRPLGCAVPPARLPGALAVLEPSLNPDAAGGALVLRLRIANSAALPQPAPLIELEFYDDQGDLTAARRFAPGNYVVVAEPAGAPGAARSAARPETQLAPGETRAVTLELAPPPAAVAGFKVRLR